jgi:hypothetical protein
MLDIGFLPFNQGYNEDYNGSATIVGVGEQGLNTWQTLCLKFKMMI